MYILNLFTIFSDQRKVRMLHGHLNKSRFYYNDLGFNTFLIIMDGSIGS